MFSISSWQVIFEAEVSGGRSGYIAIDDIQVLSYPCGRFWLRVVFFCVLSTHALDWRGLLIVYWLDIVVHFIVTLGFLEKTLKCLLVFSHQVFSQHVTTCMVWFFYLFLISDNQM